VRSLCSEITDSSPRKLKDMPRKEVYRKLGSYFEQKPNFLDSF